MPRIKRHLALNLIFFLLASLATVPVSPRPAQADFSVGEEREVGEKLLSMVRKEFRLIDDPDVSQYVNDLGQRILAVTGPQFFTYHFFVINDKEFNAFAAPSGLVFIHSGLIETMDTEGELISVMAHEVGHVTSRHIADQIKKSAKTNLGAAALMLAGIALGGGALSEAVITGSMAANASMGLKFSREDEEEADRLSFKWMQALHVNPQNMANMLRKMYRISVYRSANIPPYLLTHPEPERRLGYVEDLIANTPPGTTYVKEDNFPFLRVKYRVMVLTHEPGNLRAIFSRQAREATGLKRDMARYGLALLAENGADYAQAESLLKALIAAHPHRPILKTDLAVLYLQAGRRPEALDILKAVHAALPGDAYTAYHLAQAWEENGERPKALKMFRELEPSLPDHAMLQKSIGNLETQAGHRGLGSYHLARYFWLEGNARQAKYNLKEAIMDKTSDQNTVARSKAMLDEIERVEKNT